jgi:hypothetical protein
MNKSIIIAILLCSSFLISSCDDTKRQAKTFNDTLVKEYHSMSLQLIKYEDLASTYFANKDKTVLHVINEKVFAIIDSSISNIEKLETPNIARAKDFKQGFINTIEYQRELFKNYERYVNAKDTKEEDDAMMKIKNLSKSSEQAEEMLAELQQDFAQKNGAKVNTNRWSNY